MAVQLEELLPNGLGVIIAMNHTITELLLAILVKMLETMSIPKSLVLAQIAT
jgi:hypothetical protein